MKQRLISIVYWSCLFTAAGYGQDNNGNGDMIKTNNAIGTPTLRLKTQLEIPLVIAGAGFTLYNFSEISKKTSSSIEMVNKLNRSDIGWFDRWGVRKYSKNADNISYIPFYAAVPLPIVAFGFDKRMKKDFFALSFLYAEALVISGVLYSTAAHYSNRLRPLAYSDESPINKRTESNSKKSFFAGHVAVVATSTFFLARTIAIYYPESRYKWLYYGLAAATTAGTGVMRQAAGEHFLSDILVGATIGTLAGLLTPGLHQHRLIKNQRISLFPVSTTGVGLALFYKL